MPQRNLSCEEYLSDVNLEDTFFLLIFKRLYSFCHGKMRQRPNQHRPLPPYLLDCNSPTGICGYQHDVVTLHKYGQVLASRLRRAEIICLL